MIVMRFFFRTISRFLGNRISIVVHEDPVRWTLEVIELPAPDGPPKHDSDQQDEDYRKRNKQIENVHAPGALCLMRDVTRILLVPSVRLRSG